MARRRLAGAGRSPVRSEKLAADNPADAAILVSARQISSGATGDIVKAKELLHCRTPIDTQKCGSMMGLAGVASLSGDRTKATRLLTQVDRLDPQEDAPTFGLADLAGDATKTMLRRYSGSKPRFARSRSGGVTGATGRNWHCWNNRPTVPGRSWNGTRGRRTRTATLLRVAEINLRGGQLDRQVPD